MQLEQRIRASIRLLFKIFLAALLRTDGSPLAYTKDFLPQYEIGKFTYGVPKVLYKEAAQSATLKIGKFCSIAGGVRILLGGEHMTEHVSTYPFTAQPKLWPEAIGAEVQSTKGNVIIGNDVWIGEGALILSGVTIGDGAVVAAMSVVTHDVGAYAIVSGNPAKVKSKRFDDATIARLLELAWWDWPIEKIRENINLLCGTDIGKLFEVG